MHISNYIFKTILENPDLSYTVLTPLPSSSQLSSDWLPFSDRRLGQV